MKIIEPTEFKKHKPPKKWLCPIGHKDPETRHSHRSYTRIFDHQEIAEDPGEIGVYTFSFEVVKDEESGKKYYRLLSIHITALGTGKKANYHKDGNPKFIGKIIRQRMKEAWMVKAIG